MKKHSKVSTPKSANASVVALWGTNVFVPCKYLTPKANKILLEMAWNVLSNAFIDNVYKHKSDYTFESYKEFLKTTYDNVLRKTFDMCFNILKSDAKFNIKANSVRECYSDNVYNCIIAMYKTILCYMAQATLLTHTELKDEYLDKADDRSFFTLSKKQDDFMPLSSDIDRHLIDTLLIVYMLPYFKGTKEECRMYYEKLKRA